MIGHFDGRTPHIKCPSHSGAISVKRLVHQLYHNRFAPNLRATDAVISIKFGFSPEIVRRVWLNGFKGLLISFFLKPETWILHQIRFLLLSLCLYLSMWPNLRRTVKHVAVFFFDSSLEHVNRCGGPKMFIM